VSKAGKNDENWIPITDGTKQDYERVLHRLFGTVGTFSRNSYIPFPERSILLPSASANLKHASYAAYAKIANQHAQEAEAEFSRTDDDKRAARLAKDASEWRCLERAFSPAGIPALELDALIGHITHTVNERITETTSGSQLIIRPGQISPSVTIPDSEIDFDFIVQKPEDQSERSLNSIELQDACHIGKAIYDTLTAVRVERNDELLFLQGYSYTSAILDCVACNGESIDTSVYYVHLADLVRDEPDALSVLLELFLNHNLFGRYERFTGNTFEELHESLKHALSTLVKYGLEAAHAGIVEAARLWGEVEKAPLIRAGRGVRRGGKKGHEKVYGTQEEKAAKYTEYQTYIDDAFKQFPSESYEEHTRVAAEHFSVSQKTIKRHTHNPRTIEE
jgi:hypothetical protein